VREAEFRDWLAKQGLVASSVSTRVSDLRRVEKTFGDIDTAYARDRCAAIFEKLTYTAADEAAGKPNPSGITIDGSVRDGLAGYKAGVTAYVKFLEERATSGSDSQADRIRAFVAANYADAARARGESTFTVSSGAVHEAMGLASAMPAVCSALDGRKLADLIDAQLIERTGPTQSSTVSFTFRFNPAATFDIAAAERELRRRYGDPMPTIKPEGNQYITSFELSDHRQIALELRGASVRIWLEGDAQIPPPAGEAEFYLPEQGRQSNLPGRLRHNPRDGTRPRPVIKVRIPDRIALSKVLDWYDAQAATSGELTRAAVLSAIDECDRIGVDAFLAAHGFGRPRSYWIREQGKFYPCKAISNVAVGASGGGDRPRFDGTEARAAVVRLGFTVVDSLEAALDVDELERLRQRFLAYCPDFLPDGFPGAAPSYLGVAAYKLDAAAKAQSAIEAAMDADDGAIGAQILDILTATDLLGWRTNSRVADLRAKHPGALEQAAGALVRSNSSPSDAVGEMVEAIWPILAEGQEKSQPYSESRSIPTMLLALVRPDEAMGINTDPLGRIAKKLTGENLWGDNPLSADEYAQVLNFVQRLFAAFDDWGWQPRDLWDVQSFIWVVMVEANEASTSASSETEKAVARPMNLILYGPPGTGKTYRTTAEAVRLCDGSVPDEADDLRARFAALKDAKQIEFVTFHQSYAYEDFVEGFRPVDKIGDDEEDDEGGFRVELRRGIFRKIAALAEQSRRNAGTPKGLDLSNRQFFKMSLGRAGTEDYIYDAAIEGKYIVLGWGGDVDWSDPKYGDYQAIFDKWNQLRPGTHGSDGNISQLWRFRSSMREGDIVIVSDGNSRFRAVGEVAGPYEFAPTDVREYNHRRKVNWLLVLDEPLPVETIHDGKFTMRTCYLLKRSEMKLEALSRLLPAKDTPAQAAPDQFVLIIDEINRANISKVFGELITLIEEDKRLGARHAMSVELPYSGDQFGVPENLHIIGTMNTADRSIALLDTALRRRFTFSELMPDPDLLQEAETRTGVPLVGLLRTLNARIEYLFDREHQIGHAYFMPCSTIADVHETMKHRVIPLLAEYFYEDWNKVALVLGDADGAGRFLVRTPLSPPKGMQSDGFSEERFRWEVRDAFDDDAYDAFA
jgi:hypothetical protein